jgi:hypothetical protein
MVQEGLPQIESQGMLCIFLLTCSFSSVSYAAWEQYNVLNVELGRGHRDTPPNCNEDVGSVQLTYRHNHSNRSR